jgi:hypothetical protein
LDPRAPSADRGGAKRGFGVKEEFAYRGQTHRFAWLKYEALLKEP